MRRIIILVLYCILLSGCATAIQPANNTLPEVLGQTYYTRVNLWYTKDISTWCNHKGDVLPLGTKTTITFLNNSVVKFDIKDGQNMHIVTSRHTKRYMPGLFDLYFSKENPKAIDGDYNKLSNFDRENINMAAVVPGMSKEAVVAAYGYPPNETGSAPLSAQMWTYWGPNRLEARIKVYFRNNVVYKVEKLVLGRRGPFGIRRKRIDTDILSQDNLCKIDKNEEANTTNLASELQKISELHEAGRITDEEFKKAKENLLF